MAARQICKGLNLLRPNPRVATLQLDRPKALNAISTDMYINITEQLQLLSQDKETTFIVLEGKHYPEIGNKNCYSSGNDLKNFLKVDFSDPSKLPEQFKMWADQCENFVNAFIDSEKPIVAKVDGISYGIMCTTLPLCDFVYCTERSSFTTPFTKIAQAPEGTSSLCFPEIFGQKLAREILLQNKTFDAKVAERHGFVNKVYKSREELEIAVDKEIDDMLNLPMRSFLSSRNIIKSHTRDKLRAANRAECDNLIPRWSDMEELIPTIQKFF